MKCSKRLRERYSLRTMLSLTKTAKQIERFVIYRILHVDDTPHRLALGLALGMFVAWTPTIGFQMILVLLLAPLIRANCRVGIPVVWVSNPFTLLIIYGPNYWLGRHFLNLFMDRPVVNHDMIKDKLSSEYLGYVLAHFHEEQFWHNLRELLVKFLDVSLDLWVGSIIIGFLVGGITYVVSIKFIVWYRTHSPKFRLYLRRKARVDARKNK